MQLIVMLIFVVDGNYCTIFGWRWRWLIPCPRPRMHTIGAQVQTCVREI